MWKFVSLALLTYALIFAGLLTVKGELLVLALPLVLYLGAALLMAPSRPLLKAGRSLSAERVGQGDEVQVHVSILNQGSHLEEVYLEDLVPQGLEVVAGETRLVTRLEAGASASLDYTARGWRGDHHWKGVRVRVNEPLGLIQRSLMVPAPARVLVMLRFPRINRVAIRPAHTRVYAGSIPARLGGPGVEFFGLRGYQPGDPLRWINWKAAARIPTGLFTNEFEQMRVADVGLILDVRTRSDIRTAEGSLLERAIEAAAALADALLDAGNRVGLLLYGGVLDWTIPGYGKLQRERILETLSRAKPQDSMVFDHLEYLPARLFPSRSQLILISPLVWDDLQPLIQLRARGYAVLAISPDPVAFEQRSLPVKPSSQLAGRLAALERRLLINRLEDAGVLVLDWQVEKPFAEAVVAGLGRLPAWYRLVRWQV